MECNFENCGYYTDGECNICGMGTSGEDTFCRFCKDNPKCYYKQLQELKAENEKLKEEVLAEKIYSSQIEELEESIVGQRNAYKKLNFMYEENCEYTTKLERILQDIKAIAESAMAKQQEYKKDFEQIINIITKAESEGVGC